MSVDFVPILLPPAPQLVGWQTAIHSEAPVFRTAIFRASSTSKSSPMLVSTFGTLETCMGLTSAIDPALFRRDLWYRTSPGP
jgi:hypothetical protein